MSYITRAGVEEVKKPNLKTILEDERADTLFELDDKLRIISVKPEFLAKIEGMIPPNKDERLNKTSGGQFSPPQLVDLEAKGYNQCREDMKANMGIKK